MAGVGDVPSITGFAKEVVVIVQALALKGPKKGRCMWPHVQSRRKEGCFIATGGLGCCAWKSYGVYWFTEFN